MSSKFKLTVKLTQITPLLHFQGDTVGACLRPSEVKPKLDKFIVNYLGKENLPKQWILDNPDKEKDVTALNYKLRFEGSGTADIQSNEGEIVERTVHGEVKRSVKVVKKNIHGLYFATMGDENSGIWDEELKSKTKSVFYPSGVEAVFFAPRCPDLLEKLKKILPAFFALHCFGTRSNKGFGSFQVSAIDGETKGCFMGPQRLTEYLPTEIPALYYLQYPVRSAQSQIQDVKNYGKQYLDDIQSISALMKGGINYTHGNPNSPAYFKGTIFQYMMEKYPNHHSEKALIKRDILPCPSEDNEVKRLFNKADLSEADLPFIYLRGLLGLPQGFSYHIDQKRENGQIIKMNPHSYRSGEVKIEGTELDDSKKPLIGRFENPVHFKPYGRYILMIPQPIPQKLLGAEFKLSTKTRTKTRTACISTARDFILDDFLMYFAELYQNDDKIKEIRKIDPFSDKRNPLNPVIRTVRTFETIQRAAKSEEGGN